MYVLLVSVQLLTNTLVDGYYILALEQIPFVCLVSTVYLCAGDRRLREVHQPLFAIGCLSAWLVPG